MGVVYAHIRKDTGLPFYIGKGLKETRAYSKKNRSKYWHNIVNKVGYEIKILFQTDPSLLREEQNRLIIEKEIEYINLYGRKII